MVVRTLRPRLVGERIAAVETSGLPLRRPIDRKMLERACVGARVDAVRRIGKYWLIDLSSEHDQRVSRRFDRCGTTLKELLPEGRIPDSSTAHESGCSRFRTLSRQPYIVNDGHTMPFHRVEAAQMRHGVVKVSGDDGDRPAGRVIDISIRSPAVS